MKLVIFLSAGFILSLSTLISQSEISLNKYSQFSFISSAHATGGGVQTSLESEKRKHMNGQRRLEERDNNASVIMGTGSNPGTASDGHGTTEKDIRPQGTKRNSDYQDLDLKSDDE